MLLTLSEACASLGKSKRQVRYLIEKGRLKAERKEGRWVVRSEDLPRSNGQDRAQRKQEARLRSAVDDVLDGEGSRQTRYSLRDLRAFQIAQPVYIQSLEELGQDHKATRALRATLENLALGCHRFERQHKWDAYRDARDQASHAVCAFSLSTNPQAPAMLNLLEQELMPALAGLLRRMERKRGGHGR